MSAPAPVDFAQDFTQKCDALETSLKDFSKRVKNRGKFEIDELQSIKKARENYLSACSKALGQPDFQPDVNPDARLSLMNRKMDLITLDGTIQKLDSYILLDQALFKLGEVKNNFQTHLRELEQASQIEAIDLVLAKFQADLKDANLLLGLLPQIKPQDLNKATQERLQKLFADTNELISTIKQQRQVCKDKIKLTQESGLVQKLQQDFVDLQNTFTDFARRVTARDKYNDNELTKIKKTSQEYFQACSRTIDRQEISLATKVILLNKKSDLSALDTKIQKIEPYLHFNNAKAKWKMVEYKFLEHVAALSQATHVAALENTLAKFQSDLKDAEWLANNITQIKTLDLMAHTREALQTLVNETNELIAAIKAEVNHCTHRIKFEKSDYPSLIKRFDEIKNRNSEEIDEFSKQLKDLNTLKQDLQTQTAHIENFVQLQSYHTLVGQIATLENKIQTKLDARKFEKSPVHAWTTELTGIITVYEALATKLKNYETYRQMSMEQANDQFNSNLKSLLELKSKIQTRLESIEKDFANRCEREIIALQNLLSKLADHEKCLKALIDICTRARGLHTTLNCAREDIEKSFETNKGKISNTKSIQSQKELLKDLENDLSRANDHYNSIQTAIKTSSDKFLGQGVVGKIVCDLQKGRDKAQKLIDDITKEKDLFAKAIQKKEADVAYLTAKAKEIQKKIERSGDSGSAWLISYTLVANYGAFAAVPQFMLSSIDKLVKARLDQMADRREKGNIDFKPRVLSISEGTAETMLYDLAMKDTDPTFTRLMREEYDQYEQWACEKRTSQAWFSVWYSESQTAHNYLWHMHSLRKHEATLQQR